jgi:hypothetical protein
MNSELTLRKTACLNGVNPRELRIKSHVRNYILIKTEIDMIKEYMKHVCKERKQYIQLLQLESFHQSFMTFALNFDKVEITFDSHYLH